MTQIAGSLYGTPFLAGPVAPISNLFANGSDDILVRDTVLTAGNNIGDTVFLGQFKSNTYIDPGSTLYFDAFGAGCTLSVGDVNHTTGLANALDVHAAGTAPLWTFTAAKMGQPLWKALGYAADPGGTINLIGTWAGANPSNANLAWKITGKQH